MQEFSGGSVGSVSIGATAVAVDAAVVQVQSLALLSGLGIRCCCELRCKSQTWLRSCVVVAVAVAGSYSSDSTPSLGTSICCGCGPKKKNKNK